MEDGATKENIKNTNERQLTKSPNNISRETQLNKSENLNTTLNA